MILDFEIIKTFYEELPFRIFEIRKSLNNPLTLSEKLLYSHLFNKKDGIVPFNRGTDYVDFAPDRIAMQDATAQMALLQFALAGKNRVSIPVSVHCDHLITERSGAEEDMKSTLKTNKEIYEFLGQACHKYGIGFWNTGAGIIHQIILENYAFPGGIMIGIRLTGKLNDWTSAKDVILKITGLLTVKGGTGYIIEYFGEGAESISCSGKATICNMGAETGATCSIFGFDNTMADYLVATGRKEIADLAASNRKHLNGDPEVYSNPLKYFDKYFEINLAELEPYINGPFTPDLSIAISLMKEKVYENGWPLEVEVGLIGSCTNSSYEEISRAASIVKNALSEKLTLRSEFIIIPGSEKIRLIAERDGFMDLFRKIGGEIYANVCGPCIGQWIRKGTDNKKINSIIHSFNRNFSKRADGNPNTHAFVASPEIVTAIAISGKLTFNPITDTLINSEGKEIKLAGPDGYSLPPEGFGEFGDGYQKPSSNGTHIKIAIAPNSERLQSLKPFVELKRSEFYNMPLLIKAEGKCTTDHISMAGAWLKYRGHIENISQNYMIGAVNSFNGKTNYILNLLTGKYESVPTVARYYRDKGLGSVVVGEDNFGEGSSHEHAAMEPRFLGVKAILVKSFARIHETNLKKQGILAITFSKSADYNKIREDDRIDIGGVEKLSSGTGLTVKLNHSDRTNEEIPISHTYSETQISWFKAGSALNIIRNANTKK